MNCFLSSLSSGLVSKILVPVFLTLFPLVVPMECLATGCSGSTIVVSDDVLKVPEPNQSDEIVSVIVRDQYSVVVRSYSGCEIVQGQHCVYDMNNLSTGTYRIDVDLLYGSDYCQEVHF